MWSDIVEDGLTECRREGPVQHTDSPATRHCPLKSQICSEHPSTFFIIELSSIVTFALSSGRPSSSKMSFWFMV